MSSNTVYPSKEYLISVVEDMKSSVNTTFATLAIRAVHQGIKGMFLALAKRASMLSYVDEVDTNSRAPGSISVKIGGSTLNYNYNYPHIGVDVVFENGETLNEKHDLSLQAPKRNDLATLLFILYTVFTKDKKALDELSADKQCAFIVDVCIFDMHTALNSLASVDASDFENVKRVSTEAVDKFEVRRAEVKTIFYNWL